MPVNKKAMITGITGFAGKWLSEYLIGCGYEVYGIDKGPSCSITGANYSQISILDSDRLSDYLSSIKPDEVYHLAAISFPPEADKSPRSSLEVNIIGTVSVLDAVRKGSPDARTLLIGSSKEYSRESISEQFTENSNPDPVDFYGVSKYCAELIGMQYVRRFEMDIRFTRSFNHTGPGQSPLFVCSDWAKQVAGISLGLSEPVISVGNLQSTIDFSDVRDVVRAYHQILDKGIKGEVYNVCSGKGYTLNWILEYLTGKSRVKIDIRTEEKKLQIHGTRGRIVGDNSRLTVQTGWRSRIPFEKTLDDIYDYWYTHLSRSSSRD
ncbi:MAG TPA: GDP-mannose 4,6-dehydratase [Chitinispirillaceae bacterium]|jgi:GDP-4-dehydro-6-deoxy-D-mannose reductase|nr:GDP-mannose 4,6-dehydratase [Chitinispirillaceae bacterium]